MSIRTETLPFAANGRSPRPHIALFRALPGLGDWLCAAPAWRALRAALPHARITLIGLPHTRPLAHRFAACLDDFLPFPGFPGLTPEPPRLPALFAFFAHVRGQFDLALQMHGSGAVSNTVVRLLDARQCAGFYPPNAPCPDENGFFPYPAHLSEVQRCLSLLECLDISGASDALFFPLHDADAADFAALTAQRPFPTPYACIHPGASTPAKRWPAAGFARVADALAAAGLAVVLTGSAAERPLTTAVAHAMRHPAANLAGHTSLGALAHLLQHARLLVCNDTGVSHLAAALQTPSIVIFTAAADLPRWAPQNRTRHRPIVAAHNAAAAPTNAQIPTAGSPSCAPVQSARRTATTAATAVLADTAAILAAARALLHQEVPHAA
ncbi:MAG: glycosyltransferase family 9 protein [Anaerolineales bacterium]|nr:glycosyltransferase family 9 protein [Anaerolineales bacterium]